jgi:hypothetical protein
MKSCKNKIDRLRLELIKLSGYELMPFGKMIRARERVRQIKDELKQLQ